MIRSIVGSCLALLCWNGMLSAQPENVKLAVLNLERTPISEVTIGHPFLVMIEYITMGSTISSPQIEGMDQLHIISSRISHSPIGSKVHVRSEYTVRVDAMQSYSLGPIRIGAHSYAINCPFQAIEPQQPIVNGEQTEPFALLTISDPEPVIGQPVECTTTFFVPKKLSIEVVGAQIDMSDHMGMLSAKTQLEEYRGLRLLDGQEYQHMTWQWIMVPQKIGKLTIPASSIDYSPLQQHPMPFFASFWGSRTVKRIFSNSVSMTIHALPENEGPIHAIAHSPSIDAAVDTTQVSMGDALEYSITIQSDHPIALHDSYTLAGLPSTIKQYTSTPTSRQDNDTHYLTLASVLQCLEQEQITIPEQLIRVYDSQQKKTVEWFLPAHIITVMPGKTPAALAAIPHETNPEIETAEQLKQLQEQQQLAAVAALRQQLVPLSEPHTPSYASLEWCIWCIILCLTLYAMTPLQWIQRLRTAARPHYAYYRTCVLIQVARLLRRPDMLWLIMQRFFLMRGIIHTNSGAQLTYALPDKLLLNGTHRERFVMLWAAVAHARMRENNSTHAHLFQELLTWLSDYQRGECHA